MYIATAKTETWEEDFPGSRVKWIVGQSREIHDSFVEQFRNNPGAWVVSGGSDSAPVVGIGVKTIWTGTKAQYDAIVTKDANTQYNTDAGIYVGTTLVSGGGGSASLGNFDIKTFSADGQDSFYAPVDQSYVSGTTGKSPRPSSAAPPPMGVFTGMGSFPGEEYTDPVVMFGYNMAPNGVKPATNVHGWGIGFECDYHNGSTQVSEMYVQYSLPNGGPRRDLFSIGVDNAPLNQGKVLWSGITGGAVNGVQFTTHDHTEAVAGSGDPTYSKIAETESFLRNLTIYSPMHDRVLAQFLTNFVSIPRANDTECANLFLGYNAVNFNYANPTHYKGASLSLKQGGNGNADGTFLVDTNTNVTSNGGVDVKFQANGGQSFFELLRNNYSQGWGGGSDNHLTVHVGTWQGADSVVDIRYPPTMMITGGDSTIYSPVLHVTAQKNLASGRALAQFVARNGSGNDNTFKVGRNAELILSQVAAATVDTPPTGSISLFFDTTSGKIAYKKSDGSTVTTFA